MLLPTGGFSGGGGRPPVNIEVNFLAGDNNAFKQAREDAKALKADVLEINRLTGSGFGVVGGGGVTGSVPMSRGTAGTAAVAAPSFIAGGRSRFSASEVSMEAAETARATQRIADANRTLAQSAREVATAYVAMNTASGMGSTIRLGPDASQMRPIDLLQANIERRRRGLPDLADPTIAAAAANVAARGGAGAYGAGALAGVGGASAVALPAGLLAALVGGIAAGTPQGIEAIGGFGGFLERNTRAEGFAQQFFGRAGQVLPGAGIGGSIIRGFRNTVLSPFVEQSETGERVNRMLAGQAAGNVGYQLGQLSELSSAGFGMDALNSAKAQNDLRISQLSDQFYNRASLSPDQQFQAGEALKAAYQEQLQLKQQELSIQQSILDTRIRERDAVEQMVSSQFGSLAGRSRSDLKRLERDFQSMEDGTLGLKGANRLAGAGINTPEISQIREAYVRESAPGIASYLQGMRDTVRASVDRQTELVATLTTQIGVASDGQIKSMTGLAEAILKRFEDIDAAQKSIIEQITTQKKNDNVKSRQGVRAPGVAQ